MADKEPFGVHLEEQLAKYKAKIELARTVAKEKGPDFFERWAGDLEHLLEKYDKARYKLTLLRKGGGDALSELREGFESAMTDLKTALTKAKDKF
jgi:DNA-binding protein HU-beta